MPTPKQIAANQRNARLSTGPRTPQGKSASSQNALTHGLTARSVLIEGELPEEYERFVSDLYADFMPHNEYARWLVESLAETLWRVKRISRIEALLLEAEAHKYKPPSMMDAATRAKADFEASKPGIKLLRAVTELVIPNDALGQLGRHETRLLRQVKELRQMLREEGAPRPPTRSPITRE